MTTVGSTLIVTGALTALIGVGFFIPRQFLAVLLAEDTREGTVLLIARYMTALVAFIGGLLIYAGYHPEVRVPILIAAAAEKLVFGGLIVTSALRRRLLTMAVAGADAAMGILYVVFLVRGS